MTRNVAYELAYAVEQIEASTDPARTAQRIAELALPLDLTLKLEPGATLTPGVDREFLDVTGGTVVATFQRALDRPLAIDLIADPHAALIGIETSRGVLWAEVPRDRLSVSNPHQLLVLMIVASILLAAVAVVFLRNQVRPIRALAEAAEAFGKGRSLPVPPGRRRGGPPRRGGVPLDALAAGAADRAAHPDALRGQPRPQDAAHPHQADAGADGGERGDPRPAPGRRPDGADARRVPRLRPRRQPGGDRADRSLRARRRHRRGCPARRRDDHAERGSTSARGMPCGVAADGGGAGGAELGRQCRQPQQAGGADRAAGAEMAGLHRRGRRAGDPRGGAGAGAAALHPARGARRRWEAGGASVGLGLSIALDIARSDGGSLELGQSSALGGLRAVLRLPR